MAAKLLSPFFSFELFRHTKSKCGEDLYRFHLLDMAHANAVPLASTATELS